MRTEFNITTTILRIMTETGGYDIPDIVNATTKKETTDPFTDPANSGRSNEVLTPPPSSAATLTTAPAASPPTAPPYTSTTPPPPVTSPPPMTATTGVQSPPHSIEATDDDAAIASLVAIFPTFDHELLHEILRQCNGSEEQAVDVLLGISDPSHVPTSVLSNSVDVRQFDSLMSPALGETANVFLSNSPLAKSRT